MRLGAMFSQLDALLHLQQRGIAGPLSTKTPEQRKKCHLVYVSSPMPITNVMIKKIMLRWFGHAECKDDTDWVKHCTMSETEGIRQMFQQHVQFRNKWRRNSTGKMAINNGVCMRVCVLSQRTAGGPQMVCFGI